MFTPIPAGIRHRFIGILHCNSRDTYCFHEITSFKLHYVHYVVCLNCIKVLVAFVYMHSKLLKCYYSLFKVEEMLVYYH